MKPLLNLSIIFGLLLLPVKKCLSTPLYDQTVYYEALHDGLFDLSLADLKRYLEQSTGKTFTFLPYSKKPEKGIYVVLQRPGLLSSQMEAKLTSASIEDFVMAGDNDKMLLLATHPTGLSRAVYSYLDRLGCKWYLPGDEWTVIPSLAQITFLVNEYVTPSFSVRNFFGTGNIVQIKTLDLSSSLWGKWEAWKRRNRMGGQYTLDGHYGETFNIKHRTELEAHPEYLASVAGQRKWDASAKWCISNKAFRQLFIADRVADLTARLGQTRKSNEPIVLTVDPADGAGDCECEDCKKMGSASDRTFFLANEAAKALEKVSSRGYANIYAYNTHAAPPPFVLSSHLLVQIIPYAFQNVGTPEQMIGAWKKKQGNLLIYDYYGLADWKWNAPLTGPDIRLPVWISRLKYWKVQDIKGFLLESSYSIGSTGLGLYLTARLGWNINENPGTILQSFYTQCFGSASKDIQLYFEKALTDYAGVADLPYLVELLYKAGNETKDTQVQQRISVLKSYVHYLALLYQRQQDPGNEAYLNGLFQYVLQIYPSAAVHSTRIAELLYFGLPQGSAAQNNWRLYDPPGPGVTAMKPISNQKIEELFLQDRKVYPLLEGFDYKGGKSSVRFLIEDKKATRSDNPDGMSLLYFPETYVQASASGSIVFWVRVHERLQEKDRLSVPVQLIDTGTGKEITSQLLIAGRSWDTVRLKGVAGRTYKLVLSIPGWIRFAVPSNQWIAFRDIPTYSIMGRQWFYNEKGDKYLYYSNTGPEQPVLIDKNGKRITPEKVNSSNLYRFAMSGADKWWSIDGTEYKFLQFYTKNLLFFPHSNMVIRQP